MAERCYVYVATENMIGIVVRGEKGYYPYVKPRVSGEEARKAVDELNADIGVSKAEAMAMEIGSMFGWNVPGAKVETWEGRL